MKMDEERELTLNEAEERWVQMAMEKSAVGDVGPTDDSSPSQVSVVQKSCAEVNLSTELKQSCLFRQSIRALNQRLTLTRTRTLCPNLTLTRSRWAAPHRR